MRVAQTLGTLHKIKRRLKNEIKSLWNIISYGIFFGVSEASGRVSGKAHMWPAVSARGLSRIVSQVARDDASRADRKTTWSDSS